MSQQTTVYVQRKAKVGINVKILLPISRYFELLCCACNQLLLSPVQTVPIGHRYCKNCLNDKKQSRMACIKCNTIEIPGVEDCVLSGTIHPDKGAERDINKLPAECLRCGYQATMLEMEQHEHIRG